MPDRALVTANQAASLTADHWQPSIVVSEIIPSPPAAATVTAAGVTVSSQRAPAWRRSTVRSLMTTAPRRSAARGFGAATNSTTVLPCPCFGEVMEIQSAALDTDQRHSGATLIEREPFPPSAAIG
jgi:hypothetical protein